VLVEPFAPLPAAVRGALEDEAAAAAAYRGADASSVEIAA